MKSGDLVSVVKNDMGLVIKCPGPKDNGFFNQTGIVIKESDYKYRLYSWYLIMFPSGIYEAREDAIKVIND
tara:strand:+ start:260 stop:472 length:213 start_codon:yes stop_codon:yes gene_type:complete